MKGEIDYDFIFAFALFLILYVSVLNIIPFLTIGSGQEPDSLKMEADYLSEQLVKTPGEPAAWTTLASMQKIGLAYSKTTYNANVLDRTKLLQINGTACSSLKAKTILSVDFMINVNTRKESLNCTATPKSGARLEERIVTVYDGLAYEPGVMQLYVWR